MKTVHISVSELAIVNNILTEYIPDREVRVFGSRLNGRVKPFSDLDLVIMGDTSINSSLFGDLREAFSESDIPYKVDIVDWASTKEYFRKIIDQNNEIIFPVPNFNLPL